MMQVDDRYEGILTPEKVDRILEGAPVIAPRRSSRGTSTAPTRTPSSGYRATGGYTALGKALRDGAGGHHRGGEEVEPPRARAARASRPA